MVSAKRSEYCLAGMVLALASAGLGFAQPGYPGPFTCNASADPHPIRKEGAAELVSDIYLTCTGGVPLPSGAPINLSTVKIQMDAPITSRLVSANLSEALLIIDDAYPAHPNPASAPRPAGAGSPQNVCPDSVGGCPMNANGNPSGAPGGEYDGTDQHYNVFQGYPVGGNAVAFTVPLDAPGTSPLTMRITNIRVDASQQVSPFPLIPIHAYVSTLGQPLLSNPQPTVANATRGMSFAQTPAVPVAGTSYSTLSATFTEGFSTSFKTWIDYRNPGPENVPGFPYSTESGLWDTSATPGGLPAAGLANHGTRLMLHFTGYKPGIHIVAPSAAYLGGDTAAGIQVTGAIMYVATDANGNSAGGPKASASKSVTITTDSQGNGWLTYEVVWSDASTIETVRIPMLIESSSTGAVTGSFGPLVSGPAIPIPRFID